MGDRTGILLNRSWRVADVMLRAVPFAVGMCSVASSTTINQQRLSSTLSI